MIGYIPKVNERLIGQSISAELHTIGIIGVDPTVVPGLIRLVEVPQAPSPLSTVFVTAVGPGGPYNEIFSGTPTGNNFLVDYTTGVITFDVSNDGKNISVAYVGLGSEISAEDVNQLQVPVGVSLNYDGSLTNNIVKPATISNTGTDDFTFPRDVTVTRNLKALDFTTASVSPATTGVVRLAATDAISFGTSNYPLTTDGSGNLTWRGDVIATSTGDVTSIIGTTNQIIASSSVGAVTLSTPQDINITSSPTFVSLTLTGSLTQSETYSGSGSEQGIASDETLAAGAGKDFTSGTAYLASIMGNVHGNSLTKNANYIGGVIGADSITGTKATTYPKGAVLAQISDGVTASDGAVVAYIDGDTSVTLANAAFKAMQNNSTLGSGFTYGLDLFGAAHNGYLELSIKNAAIRMNNEVCIFNNSGAPVDGAFGTGAGFAQIGSLYINNSTGDLYSNTGTKAVPVWTIFDTGTSGANVHLSNLSAVAVNTSLLPSSDDSIDLGSSSFRWRNLLLSETVLVGGTSIAASAIVDLQSTTKGFLPPRMTNTQRDAISSPATGLIVYSTTDNQWEGWNGTSWVVLG